VLLARILPRIIRGTDPAIHVPIDESVGLALCRECSDRHLTAACPPAINEPRADAEAADCAPLRRHWIAV
jgi:hypothetical protein